MKNDPPKNWFSFYFTRLGIALAVVFIALFIENNTLDISVANHDTEITCAPSIPTQNAD